MKPLTFVRRSFLKLAGALGSGAASLLPGMARAAGAAAARPAALAAFKGEIVTRADPRYMGWFWSMTWYRIKPERYPALFARPVDRADLKLLMTYANQAGLQVVARSSGHNICNTVLQDNAITIDLLHFNEIEAIDTVKRTVWAGPGVISETLNGKLFEQGLAFPSAHTGFVTIGGYLLGGGMGWNMPAWGMGCGSVLAAEVMLADGRIVVASASDNTDLYWALRGVGPGFFGIVLRYQLKLHLAPKAVKNTYFFTLEQLDKAVPAVQALLAKSNFRSEVLGALGRFNPPGTPAGKEAWHWVLNIMSFGATQQAALDAAKVFTDSDIVKQAVSNPAKNVPLTYMDLYRQLSTDFYAQFRTTEIALFTDEPAQVLKILGKTLSAKALDQRSFGFSVLGTNPTVPEPCSYTYAAPHYVSCYLIGTTNADVQKNFALMDELYASLAPLAKGYYINEVDLTHSPQLAKACFSDEKWNKLLAVHKQYDPHKRFATYLNG